MKVITLFLLSVISATFALPTAHEDSVSDAIPGDGLEVRSHQGKFTNAELLASCPGGPGTSGLRTADRCTLINIVNNADVRIWKPLGDPQLNCKGSTGSIKLTLGGDTTFSQTTTINANLGFSGEGITIGGGISEAWGTSVKQSKDITFEIPPGKQAVYVVGVNQKSETGNVQVNYGDRQKGHYIWFTGAKVTKLTPDPDDVQFDVLETDCGSDPEDLSKYNDFT